MLQRPRLRSGRIEAVLERRETTNMALKCLGSRYHETRGRGRIPDDPSSMSIHETLRAQKSKKGSAGGCCIVGAQDRVPQKDASKLISSRNGQQIGSISGKHLGGERASRTIRSIWRSKHSKERCASRIFNDNQIF